MNSKEWVLKFYPIQAKACSEDDALDHSIQKWEGVAAWIKDHPKNGDETMPIPVDGSTCALCHHHYSAVAQPGCGDCPLALSLGGRCDQDGGPWWDWQNRADPQPMLEALRNLK